MLSHFGFGPYDAANDLGRLRDEVNRLFSGFTPNAPSEALTVNLFATQDELVLTTEVPGVMPEDVRVSVLDNTLTLQVTRPAEAAEKGWTYHRREREWGDFVRTVQLPFRVNADGVDARLDKGVLRVKLPRAEADKPRRIQVSAT